MGKADNKKNQVDAVVYGKKRHVQCEAKYIVLDKNDNWIVTFWCLKEQEHDGEHEHCLKWIKKEYKMK